MFELQFGPSINGALSYIKRLWKLNHEMTPVGRKMGSDEQPFLAIKRRMIFFDLQIFRKKPDTEIQVKVWEYRHTAIALPIIMRSIFGIAKTKFRELGYQKFFWNKTKVVQIVQWSGVTRGHPSEIYLIVNTASFGKETFLKNYVNIRGTWWDKRLSCASEKSIFQS